MKKVLAALALAVISASALAAQAQFTGNQRFVTTVTGRGATACEYQYGGQRFWRTFDGVSSCPYSVEVY